MKIFPESLLAPILFGAMSYAQCPDYLGYSRKHHAPFSSGRYTLSYQRPSSECRTFTSQAVEDVIAQFQNKITDPDLYRLFENTFPNTLDTAIKWHGYASNSTDEELTFIITGDINAMWLRDSSNQMHSYLSLLNASSSFDSIASLYRGAINLQSRYLLTSPFCNSFQPPTESGIAPAVNHASVTDVVYPPYSNQSVFECKYELDSLAAFLQISSDYYTATGDSSFFSKFQWAAAIEAVLNTAEAMQTPTYGSDGRVNVSPYTFERIGDRASETFENDGLGNPAADGTGLIRSGFRPSDDATIFQFLIPSNMFFAHYLNATVEIMQPIDSGLASRMQSLADSVHAAIESWGIVSVSHPNLGDIYAYEVDGYGSRNIMDDANIPSLLAAPIFGYLDVNDATYQQTRKMILSLLNPYWSQGDDFSAVGSPHTDPGYAWPMASIARILTSNDDSEIEGQLKQLVANTDGLGLIHESINSWNNSDWSRPWFSWANGLFGQMILDLEDRKPEVLKQSYQ